MVHAGKILPQALDWIAGRLKIVVNPCVFYPGVHPLRQIPDQKRRVDMVIDSDIIPFRQGRHPLNIRVQLGIGRSAKEMLRQKERGRRVLLPGKARSDRHTGAAHRNGPAQPLVHGDLPQPHAVRHFIDKRARFLYHIDCDLMALVPQLPGQGNQRVFHAAAQHLLDKKSDFFHCFSLFRGNPNIPVFDCLRGYFQLIIPPKRRLVNHLHNCPAFSFPRNGAAPFSPRFLQKICQNLQPLPYFH